MTKERASISSRDMKKNAHAAVITDCSPELFYQAALEEMIKWFYLK